tara:strand:+ start:785 stop:1834 length:1050 start_codon:yes stop_codon:yes gene_type:complete
MKFYRWTGRILLVGLVLVLLGTAGESMVAEAHGKELIIKVSSFAPEPADPLTRLYQVHVSYADDGEPVSGAEVLWTATREGGGPPMEPLALEPLNEPGLYAAQVAFPLYGSWNVSLSVEEAGEGETGFVEEVVPAGPAAETDEVRQKVLQLFFRFNWRDVANIAVRVFHTLGSVVWFGMTGVILVAHFFLPPASRPPVFRRLSRVFVPAAAISLGLLAVSGAFTGIYSAPVKVPGVFDLDVMWRIPFGPAYLITIGYKAVALAACGVLAVSMARALRAASYPIVAGGDNSLAIGFAGATGATRTEAIARDTTLFRLAAANAAIGVSIAVAIAVAVYLHYISHLAVFLPE